MGTRDAGYRVLGGRGLAGPGGGYPVARRRGEWAKYRSHIMAESSRPAAETDPRDVLGNSSTPRTDERAPTTRRSTDRGVFAAVATVLLTLVALAAAFLVEAGPAPAVLTAIPALGAWALAAPHAVADLRASWRSVLWLPVAAGVLSAVHGIAELATTGHTTAFVGTTAAAAVLAVVPWAVRWARGRLLVRLLRMRRTLGVTATRIVESGGARRRTTVPRASLEPGDEVLVPAGAVVPADLLVTDGEGLVTLQRLTHRADAHPVIPGDVVVAGAVPRNALVGTVVRAGDDTAIARVLRPAQAALRQPSGPVLPVPPAPDAPVRAGAPARYREGVPRLPIQRTTDKAAWWAVPLVLGVATVAGLAHGLLTDAGAGARVATAVLLAASPAAVLAAVPTALRAATLRGALLGLRMKGARPLQSARDIDLALVDPSSAIATGHPRLVEVLPMPGLDPDAALLAAVSVAQDAEGPIARALSSAARARSMTPRPISDRTLRGAGMTARIKDVEVTLGTEDLFDSIPPSLRPEPDDDAIVTYVGWGGRPTAMLRFRDRLRPGASEEVQRLLRADVVPHLMCAEPAAVARRMAERVGVHASEVTGGLDDAGRVALVQEMLDEGHRVALLTRDTPDEAAVHADLVIAPVWADEDNRVLAQVETVRPEMAAIADAVSLTRHTGAVVGQNVMLAAAYHAIAVVVVVAGWVPPVGAAALSLVPLAGVLLGSHRVSVGTGTRV
ncbi:Copper-transporting P-type ATPase [Kytococcus sedentarius]|uniref:Cation transport ATPase n=2 Tax=Kytococcus sedentarius TaxID=1276 RepID=C7NJ36_KYTSD|nr:cation transport ATPase [Kytococcus sedentarius DSM 20547]STX13332.1 Copper-transporting P-type ATPase [Kytococcus sedentarius]